MKHPTLIILLSAFVFPSHSMAESGSANKASGSVLEALEAKAKLAPFCSNSVKKFTCREIYEQDQKFKLDDSFLIETANEILKHPKTKVLDPNATQESIVAMINRQFQDGLYCFRSGPLTKKDFKKRALAHFQVETENKKLNWEVVLRKGSAIYSKNKNGSSVETITGIFCNDQAVYTCEMRHETRRKELLRQASEIGIEDAFVNQLIAEFKRSKANKMDDLINAEKDIATYNLRTQKSEYSRWLKKIVDVVKERDPACKNECETSKEPQMCYKMRVGEKIQKMFDDGIFCEGKIWSPREIKEYILTH